MLKISSDLIAETEGALALVTEDKARLIINLSEISSELTAVDQLNSFRMANKQLANTKNAKARGVTWLVLAVNQLTQKVVVKNEYTEKQEAIAVYGLIEKTLAEIKGINVLMVSVGSMSKLSETYPNYVGDCTQFVDLLMSFISQQPQNPSPSSSSLTKKRPSFLSREFSIS